MTRIALITDQDNLELTPDDQLLVPILRKEGFVVSAERWDSATTDWNSFDLCILRSCWDYHVRIVEFVNWLGHLEERHVKVLNPIPAIRWNHHKRYLKDLERRGVPIVPTYIVGENGATDLGKILHKCGWDEVVIKPCISASAYRTHRVCLHEADSYQGEFDSITQESGALVQPFIREVQTLGEWSFMFFNREFSHAVLKRPRDGEYRSQELFAGIITNERPTEDQIREATKVLDAIGGDLLYARVDMIQVNGQLLLGELELIEPSLFFKHDSGAALRFVSNLSRRFST